MSIVGDEPCPQCRAEGRDRTGNHLIIFEDGNKYCNRCGYKERNGESSVGDKGSDGENGKLGFEQVALLPVFGIPHKGISKDACAFYGVRTEFDGRGDYYRSWYPHYTTGSIDGYKGKSIQKSFASVGNTKNGLLFGQWAVKPGGKFLVITEGEDDCLAVWQCLSERTDLPGWTPSVVSITHGSSGSAKDIAANLDFVLSYERVVVCFDQDEAGRKAEEEVCQLLGNKAYVVRFNYKDANEMYLAGKGDDLKWDILKHARRYQPDGIVDGADTWDRYKHATTQTCYKYPDEWVNLNRMTYGFRLGSIVTLTSGTGVGKTQFMRELKYHVYKSTDWRIADISLEEDVGDSVAGIMSLHMGRRLHLPDVQVQEDYERRVHEELFGSGRFSFYDHFGGMDDSNLFNKIRYFGATGHRAIFLDHLSIVISEYAAEGGERERIDTVMTKLAKLAKELEIVIFIVVHLRKDGGGRSFEQGTTPSLDDLRGSGTLKQLSWDVLALSRNQQHFDPYCRNTTKVTVLKCRFSGRTGEADFLVFGEEDGRMRAVPKPANYDEERKF